MTYKEVAAFVRQEMERQKLTYEQVALDAGVGTTAISGLLGKNADGRYTIVEQILHALGYELAIKRETRDS